MEEQDFKSERSEKIEGNRVVPIYLGYQPKSFSIKWDFKNMSLARVGFMNPDFEHGFVKYILREFKKNQIKIIRMSTQGDYEGTVEDPFPLLDFEIMPTDRGLEQLEDTRIKWVQLYLNMISYINNRKREEFIPNMKYFKWQEGPLAGYIRAVEQMPSGEDKEKLLAHFKKLLVVDWLTLEDAHEGSFEYIFKIKGNTFEEKLESFFIGSWCIFNIQFGRDNDNGQVEPLLFMLQLGEELLIETLDLTARDIIKTTVQYLADLTLPALDNLAHNHNTGLFIQSPLLFPNVYPSVSHMIYGVDKTRDFDLQDLIPGLTSLMPNEALYLSKVVLGNSNVFVKKVHLPIVEA